MSDCQGTVVARGSNYVLPTASSSILGGVKVGGGLAISDAVLSATGVTPTDATTTTKGIVQITAGNGLGVASGVLSQGNLQSYATVNTPLTLSSNTIGIATATTSTAGALSAADWTTFNSKQAAITGSATTITNTNLVGNKVLITNSSQKIDTSSVTDTQLGYLSTASSNIQTQIDSKQATITGGATTITSTNLTNNRALVSDATGKVAISAVTDTQLGYLSGATGNIQSQINIISGAVNTAQTNIRYYGSQGQTSAPNDTIYTIIGTNNTTTLINTASNGATPFNTTNGRFTAPFSGMYLIHTFCNGQTVAPIFNLRHYRGTSTSFQPWGSGLPNTNSNGSMTWAYYLTANDVIILTLASGDIQNSDQICSLSFKLLI